MKEQDNRFIAKRAKIRHFLNMKRLAIKNQTYCKLMGQVVNGKKDSPLQDWEIEDLNNALDEAEQAIKDLRDEL